MPELKIVINDVKTGKSFQKVISETEANSLIGQKIGQKISGDSIGLHEYELEVRGGSDYAGFPMRFDVEGLGRKKPYLSRGPGVRGLKKGQKTRKSVIGNTITNTLAQVNLKIIKYGTKTVEECLGIKPKEKEEKTEATQEIKE